MSAISGIGSAQVSQLLQRSGLSPQSFNAESFRGIPQGGGQKLESLAQKFGIEPSQFSNIRADIKSAVEANADAIAGSDDPKGDMQSLINGVLEEHGVDPAEFRASLQSMLQSSGGMLSAYKANATNVNGSFSSTQNDTLNSLLAALESSDEEDDSAQTSGSLLDYFKDLPSGSFVNQTA
ncbi:MAG: hypothetical protein AAGB34_00135 [Planctomycetota bacterium]